LFKKLESRRVRSKKKKLTLVKEVTETGHNGDYAYYGIFSKLNYGILSFPEIVRGQNQTE